MLGDCGMCVRVRVVGVGFAVVTVDVDVVAEANSDSVGANSVLGVRALALPTKD